MRLGSHGDAAADVGRWAHAAPTAQAQ
jgi:hypothetical protein